MVALDEEIFQLEQAPGSVSVVNCTFVRRSNPGEVSVG